jgi:hypothetical protein
VGVIVGAFILTRSIVILLAFCFSGGTVYLLQLFKGLEYQLFRFCGCAYGWGLSWSGGSNKSIFGIEIERNDLCVPSRNGHED